jgi:UDP-N-acetylglucosamine--N-acetylmuramyl-(pentapeptide) pyrophosphoryl-undecaprenol N-acetylglucosamine transferase
VTRRTVEIVVAGGGTAGHVEPALALAESLVTHGLSQQAIRFVGTRRGVEARLVRPAGFAVVELPGRGIVRRASVRNVRAICGLVVAAVVSAVLVRVWRPRVVVSVGGYGALGCALAALLWRVPVVVLNVDAVPGAANRLIARFAKASATAVAGSGLRNEVVTGAPVRRVVMAAARAAEDRAQSKRDVGLDPTRALLLVVGGSLGARRLNELALALAQRLADRNDLSLYHVSGERDYAECAQRAKAMRLDDAALAYELVAYEQRLPDVFAAADLAISRGGASTVAEVAVIGTPTIFVPLPGAPGDHQRRNAERLAVSGGAEIVADDRATIEQMWERVLGLLKDEPGRDAMRAKIREVGRPDAAERVAELVQEVGRLTPSGRSER